MARTCTIRGRRSPRSSSSATASGTPGPWCRDRTSLRSSLSARRLVAPFASSRRPLPLLRCAWTRRIRARSFLLSTADRWPAAGAMLSSCRVAASSRHLPPCWTWKLMSACPTAFVTPSALISALRQAASASAASRTPDDTVRNVQLDSSRT